MLLLPRKEDAMHKAWMYRVLARLPMMRISRACCVLERHLRRDVGSGLTDFRLTLILIMPVRRATLKTRIALDVRSRYMGMTIKDAKTASNIF